VTETVQRETRFASFLRLRALPAGMSLRNDVAPDTLSVSLEPEGVEVGYMDGRSVFYHGVPERTTGPVNTPPGRDVHVLVTDPTETEGVLVYVNDRMTADEILEDTGVGRVLLEPGEGTTLFPGVEAEAAPGGYRITVDADPNAARGRVFVFAEDATSEHSWEIVADEEGASESLGDASSP
jgi:hypothetical protein